MSLSTRVIRGLGDIADRYDATILDLWGCLHDGVRIYPAALDALHRLKSASTTSRTRVTPMPSSIVPSRAALIE